MVKYLNPETVRKPGAHYSQACEVKPGARYLFVAGQTGRLPDDTIRVGIDAQAEQALRNLKAVLESAGMGLEDMVARLAHPEYLIEIHAVAAREP